jgi:hypothetical protein
MININNEKEILEYFDKHPGEPLTVFVPASGSWCETFNDKDHYIRRQKAEEDFDNYFIKNPDGKLNEEGNKLLDKCIECQGRHSYPWLIENYE